MKKLNPIKIMEKFRKTDVREWPEMLKEYDYETLCDLIGLLMISNFYTVEQVKGIRKILGLAPITNRL